MKTLKFRSDLASLILSGEKNNTWRLFDDKDLQSGDDVIFVIWETNIPFANAKLIEVYEKQLGELDVVDKDGHEEFSDTEEMLRTYSKYYMTKVTLQTPLKIIKFEISEIL